MRARMRVIYKKRIMDDKIRFSLGEITKGHQHVLIHTVDSKVKDFDSRTGAYMRPVLSAGRTPTIEEYKEYKETIELVRSKGRTFKSHLRIFRARLGRGWLSPDYNL